MGGNRKAKKVGLKKSSKTTKNSPKKQLAYTPGKITEKHSHSGPKRHWDKRKGLIIGVIAVIAIVTIAVVANHKSYEQYDLKGLTVKEACEKARSAGWSARVIADQGDDKTDCYNTEYIVSKYVYGSYCNGCVTIYYDGSEIEKQKKEKCEADGKWYRDGRCRSQEEWENDYAWKNAHAACKKYGSSGYAKTLTDCYVGSEYKGPVNGETTDNYTSSDASQSSASSSSTSWRQVLADYESWMNKYIDFMVKYKNTSDYSTLASMMSEYSALLSEMTEWTEKLDNVKSDLSTADLTEYIQTLTRINQRLSELY